MAATGKRFKAEQIVNLLREIDVMTADRLRDWLAHISVKTAYIEPGSPCT